MVAEGTMGIKASQMSHQSFLRHRLIGSWRWTDDTVSLMKLGMVQSLSLCGIAISGNPVRTGRFQEQGYKETGVGQKGERTV